MSEAAIMKSNPKTPPVGSVTYQIRVAGHLGPQWADWFNDATVTLEKNGVTLITCQVVDQSALYGMLKKVRDMGLPLLSVQSVEPNAEEDRE